MNYEKRTSCFFVIIAIVFISIIVIFFFLKSPSSVLKVAKEDDRIKKKIEMLCGEKFIEKDEICETLSRL